MSRANPTISEALRRAMRSSDATLVEIAAATGIDAGRLSRFARGERTLTLPAADALARYFGLQLVNKGTRHER